MLTNATLLTEAKTALLLHLSPVTLQKDRLAQRRQTTDHLLGIPYHKIGRAVRYQWGEVRFWLSRQREEVKEA